MWWWFLVAGVCWWSSGRLLVGLHHNRRNPPTKAAKFVRSISPGARSLRVAGCRVYRQSRSHRVRLLRHKAAEDAEVRRVLPSARASHIAHSLAQREPVLGLQCREFAIRVQTHLCHVTKEIRE